MSRLLRSALIVASLLQSFAVLDAAGAAGTAGEVTIYRCVAAGNKVSLQDHPCPKDAHQDVREMIRPQDPPSRPQPIAKAVPVRAPAQVEVRIVHVHDPQPLYECHSFDGSTYLSQTGVPEQHFVPLWVLGRDPYSMDAGIAHVGSPAPVAPSGSTSGPIVYPPGSWVQDRCDRLPQAEVCQRLRDREDNLGTRIFNAQPSDRAVYERERQGLVEQLRSDCSTN